MGVVQLDMENITARISFDKVKTRLHKETKKLFSILCADFASATFVRLVRITLSSAISILGTSIENHLGDITSSTLNILSSLLEEV